MFSRRQDLGHPHKPTAAEVSLPEKPALIKVKWPPRPRGPIKFEAALTFITKKASPAPSCKEGKHLLRDPESPQLQPLPFPQVLASAEQLDGADPASPG